MKRGVARHANLGARPTIAVYICIYNFLVIYIRIHVYIDTLRVREKAIRVEDEETNEK